MRKVFFAFVLVGVFIYAETAGAEMTSTNYQIRWDSITTGGSDTSSSASYTVRDSFGEPTVGSATSTNYIQNSGYRAGVYDQILTFDLFAQPDDNLRAVSSVGGLTFSTTNTSGISAGDYVVLVQDLGSSQISAVGKVSSVSSNVSITVDAWSTNGTMPVVDNVGDYYRELNGYSASFGELSDADVSTLVIGMEVNADLDNGYSISLASNGGFASGSNTISGVFDGSVTAGSVEYGAISSDTSVSTSTFDTQDTSISPTFTDIVTQSVPKFSDRSFLTLKAAKNASIGSGTFTQSLTFVASGNY